MMMKGNFCSVVVHNQTCSCLRQETLVFSFKSTHFVLFQCQAPFAVIFKSINGNKN